MAGNQVLSVVIPTYQRPLWIVRAVRSLQQQGRPPDEVIAVARDTDHPTHEAIEVLSREVLPFTLRRELVSAPGFMPPVELGIRVANGEVIAVMDDDAEAVEGWAARLIAHYADERVGAVGGLCINTSEAGPDPVPSADRVGFVNLRGQFIGRMFHRPTFSHPVEVDFLMGGNMSFRRDVARRLEFDMILNKNVAQGYEVDLGLQVRNMGLKIIFDPSIAIRHYSAPREVIGNRLSNLESAHSYAFNQARVALRRLPLLRRSISFAYQMALGEKQAPGVVPFVLAPLARRLGFRVDVARAAIKGRVLAARSVLSP